MIFVLDFWKNEFDYIVVSDNRLKLFCLKFEAFFTQIRIWFLHSQKNFDSTYLKNKN